MDVLHLLGPDTETRSSPVGGWGPQLVGSFTGRRRPVLSKKAKAMKGMKRRAMRRKKAAAPEEAPMKAMRRK